MKQMWGFTIVAITVSGLMLQAQGQSETRTTDSRTVAGSGGSSATLSDKHAVVMPAKGYKDVPYDEMHGNLGKFSSDVSTGLQKIEEAREMIEDAKKKIPRARLPLYLRAMRDENATTSTESVAELDELSTKTKARLRKARRTEEEIRRRMNEGLL